MEGEPAMVSSAHKLHDEYDHSAGIGGSSVAAALGLSKFMTRRQLYEKITGDAPVTDNRFMYWGRMLEAAIADGFAERTGMKLRRPNRTYRHREHPFLLAHVDRLGYGFVFEAKTSSVYADGWGETLSLDEITPETWNGERIAELSDDMPDDYGLQLQHYMALTNRPLAFLAVLVGGNEAKLYRAERDEELYNEFILPGLVKFWREHVVRRVPPELVAADEEGISRRYPRREDDLIISPTDLTEAAGKKLLAVKRLQSDLAKQEKLYRARLEEAIGPHEGMIGGEFKITWKNDPDKEETVWQHVAASYRGLLEEIANASDTAALTAALAFARDTANLDALESIHTNKKKGSRRFLITEIKKESGDESTGADGAEEA
jgi:putative phage-type endonuclease